MFVAVGLFCSSLTRSQVVAAVTTVALLFVITIAPYLLGQYASQLSPFLAGVADQERVQAGTRLQARSWSTPATSCSSSRSRRCSCS
jgi:hypothetical protein